MKFEKKGIKLAFERAENADLIIFVMEPKSVDFTNFLKNFKSKKSIILINKMDHELNLKVMKLRNMFQFKSQ